MPTPLVAVVEAAVAATVEVVARRWWPQWRWAPTAADPRGDMPVPAQLAAAVRGTSEDLPAAVMAALE